MKIILKIKSKIREIIFHYISSRGYKISYPGPKPLHEVFVDNFFKTNHQKNALISYLVHPFISPINTSHSNMQECMAIAELLRDLAYNVDVINWDNNTFLPKKEYDILVDNHQNLERLDPYLSNNCIKILHITHALWFYQNMAEYKCIESLYKRRGVVLKPQRYLTPSNSIEHCDFSTCLGNDFTINTYNPTLKRIFKIPVSSCARFELSDKNIDKCKSNFLWFGGRGLVLKGLDIVLEAFSKMPQYNLTICGPIEQEPDFKNLYYHELYELPNIYTKGWVDLKAEDFKEILKNNIAVISISFSEGGGASVITCMHGGLIPIVSLENSIDVGDFGMLLKNNTIDEVQRTIESFTLLPDNKLIKMRKDAYNYANTKHTLKSFKKEFKKVLESNLLS